MDLPDLPSKVEPDVVGPGDAGKVDAKPEVLPGADPVPAEVITTKEEKTTESPPAPTSTAPTSPGPPPPSELRSPRMSMAPVSVQIPITLPTSERSRSSRSKDTTSMTLQSGYFGMQGRRPTMEDYHIQLQHPELNRLASQQGSLHDRTHRSLFAIYDGHGGQWCADYCSKMIQQNLVAHEQFREKSSLALSDAIIRTDENFCKLVREKGFSDSSGSTAIVVYIVDDQIIVANVGDSRAVLCRSGKCVALSSDHKPNRKDERARITSLGGYVGRTAPKVTSSGVICMQKTNDCWSQACMACCAFAGPALPPYRVYPGGLAISRSIGDLEMKATRLVISTPEIQQVPLLPDDEFVILGCDGVWDVISNEEAVRLVRAFRQKHGEHPMEAAKHLASTAYAEGSSDNISVLVIYFRKGANYQQRSR